jgi:hypothetical protein
MDTLDIGYKLLKEFTFLEYIYSLFPFWVWIIIVYLFTTFLLKPYIQAIVKLYQSKLDKVALNTPTFFKRIFYEVFRIIYIIGSFPFILMFFLTPKNRRLRVWRKNEIVFIIWIFSKKYPDRNYYKRVRTWFEVNVYLDKRTSLISPEPLKQDKENINKLIELNLNVTHNDFINNFLNKGKRPIVRVGSFLSKMNPIKWMGKILFILWFIYGWIYSILFIGLIYFIFSQNYYGLIAFILGILFYIIDRIVLTRFILNKAKNNEKFYHEALKVGVIQLYE